MSGKLDSGVRRNDENPNEMNAHDRAFALAKKIQERSKNLVGELKACFRVPAVDRIERLTHLQKLGFGILITVVCDAHDPENEQCRGCGLFEIEDGNRR